jgi:isopentenyl-diphosphate Delta-isomerase
MSMNFLEKYDPQQVNLLNELLIVVDKQDRILGQATKKDAHLLSNIEDEPSLIHRAFSFFLFDHSASPSRLILQQRSSEKITYPSLWANTCCSHPLYNDSEIDGLNGVKRAVQRRVQYELGYELKLNLTFQKKIFYQARNIPDDDIFGESEVDYIVFANYRQATPLDLTRDFNVNVNEIKSIQSLTLKECEELVENNLTTPWFTRIVREGLLAKWWPDNDENESDEMNQISDVVVEL